MSKLAIQDLQRADLHVRMQLLQLRHLASVWTAPCCCCAWLQSDPLTGMRCSCSAEVFCKVV